MYSEFENESIRQFCINGQQNIKDIVVFCEINICGNEYTSKPYKCQKLRKNFFITYADSNIGLILFYFSK